MPTGADSHGRLARRRALRKALTPAEAALWRRLKGRELQGRRFRRQHSAGPYILDFYGMEERLAVELDGEVHHDRLRSDYDARREAELAAHGIRVIRFENRQIFEQPEAVLAAIAAQFQKRAPKPEALSPGTGVVASELPSASFPQTLPPGTGGVPAERGRGASP